MMKEKTIKKISLRIFQLTIVVVIAYILVASVLEARTSIKQPPATAVLFTQATNTPAIPFPVADTRVINPFTYLNLSAKAVIVYDLNDNRIIFSQQKDAILPIASITKLMTIYTATKTLLPETKITITQEDLNLDSTSGLVLGENWSFKDLTAFTLISSSNAGANAIAREAQNQSQLDFVSQMNETAKQIGLQNSFFRDVTGLDLQESTISGAESTAQDIAYLYAHILNNNPELLAGTNKNFISISSLDNIKHEVTNTNGITSQIPALISSKTGTTDLAGGNLAILFNPLKNHPVAIVVLGATPDGRFGDIKKLVGDTIRVLKKQ